MLFLCLYISCRICSIRGYGFVSIVDNGFSSFTGGQRARVALARAVYSDAEVNQTKVSLAWYRAVIGCYKCSSICWMTLYRQSMLTWDSTYSTSVLWL